MAQPIAASFIFGGQGRQPMSQPIPADIFNQRVATPDPCSPFGPPALLGQHKYTKMTAVTVAFQRATPDLPEMPTTPGRPRDVQVAPQPLMAPGSPVTPRTGDMLPFLLWYESTLVPSLHLNMLQPWKRRTTPGKLY